MFQGCPATGREWSASCTAIYRIEHGRIVDFSDNWDWLGVMEQLGTIHRAATASS
jgi:predicted ester cyclase